MDWMDVVEPNGVHAASRGLPMSVEDVWVLVWVL